MAKSASHIAIFYFGNLQMEKVACSYLAVVINHDIARRIVERIPTSQNRHASNMRKPSW